MQSAVESFLLCNTNFILSPISDSSIVRKGYYGFNDSVIPKELYLKDSDAAINSLMSIPRYSKVLETEWRPEGMYFELSDGHAICFHDTTSLAFMLVENGIVRNTIEYKIDSALVRDLLDPNLINFKSIKEYEEYGSVHGNVRSVKERGYHIVQKFGKPVKEIDYTADYTYDEKGRLLSYYYMKGDPNKELASCSQKDKVFNYKDDGSYTMNEIFRDKYPHGRLEVRYNSLSGFDASGNRVCDYDKNGAIKWKYDYKESTTDGSIQIDKFVNGELSGRTIQTKLADGSYNETKYKGDGAEDCSFFFNPNGLLLSKRSASRYGEDYKVKYDEFNQLNVVRTGQHGNDWKYTNWPSDGLERYDHYGNLIEKISIYDDVDVYKKRNIRTYWDSYEYTYDSYGNWITREKIERIKDEQYLDKDSYNRWVNNYLNDYSFRGNNISGFSYSDSHVERDIEYY